MHMMKDRIGQHKFLLPRNHNLKFQKKKKNYKKVKIDKRYTHCLKLEIPQFCREEVVAMAIVINYLFSGFS